MCLGDAPGGRDREHRRAGRLRRHRRGEAAVWPRPDLGDLLAEDRPAGVRFRQCRRVDYRQEWRIATYPIERGGFMSYNKVKSRSIFGLRSVLRQPGPAWFADPRRRAALTDPGLLRLRQPAHDAAAARRGDRHADLVSVITPEAQYPFVNIIHYDYRREARGRHADQGGRLVPGGRPAPAAGSVTSVVTRHRPVGQSAMRGTAAGWRDPGPGGGDRSKAGGTAKRRQRERAEATGRCHAAMAARCNRPADAAAGARPRSHPTGGEPAGTDLRELGTGHRTSRSPTTSPAPHRPDAGLWRRLRMSGLCHRRRSRPTPSLPVGTR